MACTSDAIPFVDLVTPHVELEGELTEVFKNALHTAGFVGGAAVSGFERAFAKFCDVSEAIAVSSGTDALRFALIASGIRPGDIVLTVPHTFIGTTEAISQAGALPEFIDIDEYTYSMSVEQLALFLSQDCIRNATGQLISQKWNRPVTAILPVHLYGQMANMDPIMDLARDYGLLVIEDACQAHGAEYLSRDGEWKRAGSIGHAAAFSFYPGKNLGACGEGGAVTTNSPEIAAGVMMLRDHGQKTKYYHSIEGYNGRLDAIQAGLLHVKLAHLEKWNETRRERAVEYNRLLHSNSLVSVPCEPSWSRSVYHLYVIQTQFRDEMMAHLKAANIGTAIHYPVPLHKQKAYELLGYAPEDFPVSSRVADEIVSLPMHPYLTSEQQIRIAEAIFSFEEKVGALKKKPMQALCCDAVDPDSPVADPSAEPSQDALEEVRP